MLLLYDTCSAYKLLLEVTEFDKSETKHIQITATGMREGSLMLIGCFKL